MAWANSSWPLPKNKCVAAKSYFFLEIETERDTKAVSKSSPQWPKRVKTGWNSLAGHTRGRTWVIVIVAASRPCPLSAAWCPWRSLCQAVRTTSVRAASTLWKTLQWLAKLCIIFFKENQCSFQNMIFPLYFMTERQDYVIRKMSLQGGPHSSTSAGGVVTNSFNRDYNSGFTF